MRAVYLALVIVQALACLTGLLLLVWKITERIHDVIRFCFLGKPAPFRPFPSRMDYVILAMLLLIYTIEAFL
jgi:hypothetical protein